MSHLKFVPAVVVFFLCPLFGQHNALLRSHGVVKVNGTPATSSTVVMEGDRIDTGKNSSASLLLPGRMISVESGSSVVYHDGNVVPSPSVAKLSSASAMPHDSDKDKDKDKDDKDKDKDKDNHGKDKQKCLSASGNKSACAIKRRPVSTFTKSTIKPGPFVRALRCVRDPAATHSYAAMTSAQRQC